MHADAPIATPRAMFYMQLYRRIRRWKALPGPGGILDQDESVIRGLDLIADLVDAHDRRQAKMREQRLANMQVMGSLGARGQRPAAPYRR